jgi:hypothetical protein
VERFDAEISAWDEVASMQVARAWASAGVIGSRIYICGGSDSLRVPYTYLNTAEHFDPEINTWTFSPPMLEPRRCAAAGVLLNSLYVCGGSSGMMPLNTVEAFDPRKATWAKLPPMPTSRRNAACCAIGGTTLCVCGGEDGSGNIGSALLFAVESRTWISLPNRFQGAWWCSAAASTDSVYVCGGTDGAKALDRVECFNVSRMEWEVMPSMLEARVGTVVGTIAGLDQMFCL